MSRLHEVGVVVVLAGMTASTAAWGQSSPADAAAAETLFVEGKRLAAAGQLAEACAKFTESQRLDPGTGTLLELAQCDERAGKTASAWAEYTQALSASKTAGRLDRVQFASEGIARVQPQMAHLTIRLATGASAPPGLEIRRDGVLVGPGALGEALPVDSGEHVVVASAPGRATWTQRVILARGPTASIVDVPVLAELPEATPGGPTAGSPPSSPWKTLGLVAGGVGVASVVLGGYFGLKASSDWNDFKTKCQPSACTDAAARPLYDDARSSATLSTVFVAAGAVALVGGAYLFLFPPATSSSPGVEKTSLAWAPFGGPDGAGITFRGRW